MKKIVKCEEVEGEGLMALLGEKVLLLCANYFYAGTLTGVNEKCVLLSDAYIVYETGNWADAKWKDAQKIGDEFYVQTNAIEAYGKGK